MSEAVFDPPETTVQPFSANHVSRLIVNSFRFSRGNEAHQKPIMAFWAKQYGQQLAKADLESAEELTLKAARDKLASPQHPTYADGTLLRSVASVGVAEAYGLLKDYINDKNVPECAPPVLLGALIHADSAWRPGIPGTGRDPGYKPQTYKSNVVRFVIRGESTNIVEVDAMLSSARTAIDDRTSGESYYCDRAVNLVLPLVMRAHFECSPDDRDDTLRDALALGYSKASVL